MGKTPVYKNPFIQGFQTLLFDNDDDSLYELTTEQKMDKFMSDWIRNVNPYELYPTYFNRGNVKTPQILRDVKRMYEKKVVNSDWSGQKYVYVVDHIFSIGSVFNEKNLDIFAKFFDKGKTRLQIMDRKAATHSARIKNQ